MSRMVVLLVILSLVLVACGDATDRNDDVAPDSHIGKFRPVCDIDRHIGMWIYSRSNGAGDSSKGYGFGMRMTEAEYAKECFKYEQ